jgi:hypothetical protein
MIEDLKYSMSENPVGAVIAALSFGAIVVGLGLGLSRGNFVPDAKQQRIESLTQAQKLQEQTIKIANQRFDDGCEGVFYLKPGTNVYQPLTEGTGVLSGAYWQRWKKTGGKTKPNLSDYLPAGTPVCDAYGNVGILEAVAGDHAIVGDLLNTPDRTRITKMMNRYPKATRPQVGS